MLLSFSALAENRIKIAVIDSGISRSQALEPYMCENGIKSFINKDVFNEGDHHGTNIVNIIQNHIDTAKYCIISYKVWSFKKGDVVKATVESLKDAYLNGARYVNISMSGHVANDIEKIYFKKMLDEGVNIVVAAGNGDVDHNPINLNNKCIIYPACYKKELKHDNFYVVASLLSSSNYGDVVTDTFPGYKVGYPVKSGTSQAAAQKTARLIQNMIHKDKYAKI
jgi:hypothetical protein